MRLRAQITIDIEAADFLEAADHQRQLETILGQVKKNYMQAALQLRERRQRAASRAIAPKAPLKHYTGKLSAYADRG
ncbi:hypothetical protein [Caulobacter sp. 17J65-9]|uniref:hypothetical protein n=1 Tax=Caulobacter sp. 17J65-9 TaxID=2709382 RepID=UPI0013CC4C2F|nr:hypothetical protein [Caulobacter sp. 17J65-9]NEX92814.1 hypothetical protein [Caulobacter sp. 17J65-9]